MAPKRKKRASIWARGNARGKARRAAVLSLNALASEVGAKPIRAKAKADAVEQLVRFLEPRCHPDELFERLRDAVPQLCSLISAVFQISVVSGSSCTFGRID